MLLMGATKLSLGAQVIYDYVQMMTRTTSTIVKVYKMLAAKVLARLHC